MDGSVKVKTYYRFFMTARTEKEINKKFESDLSPLKS